MLTDYDILQKDGYNILFLVEDFVAWFSTDEVLINPHGGLGAGHLHSHSVFDIHIAYNEPFTMLVEEQEYCCHKGEILLIAPGSYHKSLIQQSAQTICFKLSFLRHTIELSSFHGSTKYVSIASPLFSFNGAVVVKGTPLFFNLLQQLQQLIGKDEFGIQPKCQGLLTAMTSELSCLLQQASATPKPLEDPRKEVAEYFFSHNLQGDHTLTELAKQLHCSARQLNRLLQEYYGMSFKDKFLATRITVAKNMLCHTNSSISEIALLCGYQSDSGFINSFRKAVGQTPLKYRNSSKTRKIKAPGL